MFLHILVVEIHLNFINKFIDFYEIKMFLHILFILHEFFFFLNKVPIHFVVYVKFSQVPIDIRYFLKYEITNTEVSIHMIFP